MPPVDLWLKLVAGLAAAGFAIWIARLEAKATPETDPKAAWHSRKGPFVVAGVWLALAFSTVTDFVKWHGDTLKEAAAKVQTDRNKEQLDSIAKETQYLKVLRDEFETYAKTSLSSLKAANNSLSGVDATTKNSLKDIRATSVRVTEASGRLDKVANRQEQSFGTLKGITKDLTNVSKKQSDTLVDTWKIQRPFGRWTFTTHINYPLFGREDQNEFTTWINRIVADGNLKTQVVGPYDRLEVESSSPLLPHKETEKSTYDLLVEPPLLVSMGLPNGDIDVDRTLGYRKVIIDFYRGTRRPAVVNVFFNDPVTLFFRSQGLVTSWLDLYGGTLNLLLYRPIQGARLTDVYLGYSDTLMPSGIEVATIMPEPVRQTNQVLEYQVPLNAETIGPIPPGYPGKYPARYDGKRPGTE